LTSTVTPAPKAGLERGQQGIAIAIVLGALAERRRRMCAEFPEEVQAFDPGGAGITADLGVECRAVRSDFTHVAQYQEFRARGAREHLDRGDDRIRIGVIGIVEDDAAALAGLFLQPPPHRFESGEPARNRGQANASRRGSRGSREGIAHVVHPGRVQTDRHLPLWGAQYDFAAEIAQFETAAHGRGPLETEVEHSPWRAHAAPILGIGVIGIDHRHAVRGQRREHRAVLVRHVGHALHEFLMLALGIVHQGHGRLRDAGR